jgi:signal transduction histidine kinase
MDVDSQVFELRPGVMIAGKAFAEQQPVFSLHAARDDPRYAAYYRAVGSTALYAAPVSTAGRRLGVLVVYSPRPPIFGQSDLELVQLLADQAAFVLENRILIEETAAARARADANRLKDEFLSGISHDLRNPLTALHGLVQVLERRLDQTGHVDPDRLHSALALIRASSAQMSGLVDQLVDYGRVRMDQPLDLNLRPTDLVILARRTIEAYATTSDRHTVRLEAGSERLEGRWDARRLERVLQNLLSNAFKYSPAGGEITVRIDLEPSEGRLWARLQVQDRGIGIPEADLPFVFDRFHRASNSRGAVPGTGIGLATVQQIVVQHDGTISVSSQMGAGTTVTVRLPAATQITRGTAPEPGLA